MMGEFADECQPPLVPHKAKGVGVMATSFTIVCQMAGVGILQLPFTLRQGGWSMLVVMVICMACASITGKLLIGCLYDRSGVRIHDSYAAVGRAAFGAAGHGAVHFFEKATLFGVSTLFLILAGKFLEELLGVFPTRTWILIAAAVVAVPVILLPTIRELKAITFLGVGATALVVACVLVVATLDRGSGRPGRAEGPTELLVPGGFATAFSGLCLSLTAHAGLPAVESHMRDPKDFGKAFNYTYLVLFVLYLPVAIVGYWAYGNQVYSPILCSLPRDGPVQVIAKALCTTHVITTAPVLIHLFLGDFERGYKLTASGATDGQEGADATVTSCVIVKRTIFRSIVVVSCAVTASVVPYFADMMSFIGAVCVVMTAFVMPSVFHLRLRWSVLRWWQVIVPVLVAVVGTVGGVVGAIQAASDIVNKLQHGSDPNDG